MLIGPVIERLRAAAPAFAGRVAGAADLPAIEDQESFPVPCAFVVPLEDDPGENTTAGGTTQEVTETIGVIVVISTTADERGQAAAADVEAVRQELFAALLDWPPAAGYGGFFYAGGFIVDLNRARLIWRFDFSALNVIAS